MANRFRITDRPQHVIGADQPEPSQDYWLAGVWDNDGHLIWSSEPESFETKADAMAAARIKSVELSPPDKS